MVSHESKIEFVKMESAEVKLASMKKLIGPDEGWDSHVMRLIELGPKGFSPKHNHDWPHINYILQGEGTLFIDGQLNEIKKGSIAYVPSGSTHQFANKTDGIMRLMCIVPKEGHL